MRLFSIVLALSAATHSLAQSSFYKNPGEVCDPDAYECDGSSTCHSPVVSDSSRTYHCCDSSVGYSCDGCGSDGMCNYCSSTDQEVDDDKTGCTTSSTASGGSSSGGSSSGGSSSGGSSSGGSSLPQSLDQGGIIAGAIAGSVVVIVVAVTVAIVASNKAKKEAEAANSPVESSLCCCGRSWATSVSVVALSCILAVLVICFSQTFIAQYIIAATTLASTMGYDNSGLSTTKLLHYDLPLILTIVAAILALATLASYRFLGKGFGCGVGVLAIVCAIGSVGISGYVGFYYLFVTAGAMPTAAGNLYMSYYLIALLIFVTGIILITCIGIHIGKCCCCCKRPDEADETDPVFVQAHAIEMGNPAAGK